MTKIPSKEDCIKILKDNNVPANIIAHSVAVCDFSMKIVDLLGKKGIRVNCDLVAAGALLHDIRKAGSNDHIIEGYEFIKSLGFPEVALIVKKHGLAHLGEGDFIPTTTEEKVVFYADKRVKGDEIVGIGERFGYIKQRYKKDDIEKEYSFTKKMEGELLGDEKL